MDERQFILEYARAQTARADSIFNLRKFRKVYIETTVDNVVLNYILRTTFYFCL